MSNRSKQYVRLIDSSTGELMISADLTPAAVKRFIREYKRFNIWLEVI